MSTFETAAMVRRQEFTCTEQEIASYPDKVLAENEVIYVRMNDGTIKMKMGDGTTRIYDLPFVKVFDAHIKQKKGDSEEDVMSQKAVTYEVNRIESCVQIESDRLYDKASMVMAESRNLFDGYIIPNTVIGSTTGAEKHSDTYRTTRYIEVEPSQIYSLYGWAKYSFYDADYNYLSSGYTKTAGRAVMTTPDNCKYVRLGTDATAIFEQQVYKGDVNASKTTYEHSTLRSEYLGKSVVRSGNNTFNLFNGVVVEKTTINADTGLETENADFRTSEYIPVMPSAFYTAYKWNSVAFYKKDYTFHSRQYCVSEPIVKIPDGCYYVRLSTSITKRDQMFLRGAFDGIYYSPYKETIPADMVDRQIWKDETYFYDKMVGYFNAPEQEAFNPTASERTVESIYGIYDELMAAYPNYITKTDLGLDQMGRYHIYRYDFKPESPRVPELDAVKNKHLPKIIIFSGVHGLERWSIYAVAQLMKLICTNPDNDPILEYYRQGIEFIVVPLVNPWGYVEGTRWNSRGVNINRNLSSGWKVSGSEAFTIDYEGPNAFSEAESSIVKKLLEENLDAFAVIDAHTHDITEWDKTYWCIASTGTHFYRDGIAIARNIVAKISKHLKSDYKQDFEGFAGYVEGAPAGGGVASYAVMRCGLNGMTAEVVDKLVGESESGTPLTNQVNVEFYANLIAEIIKYYQ